MIYYQLKFDYFDHKENDLFTHREIKRYKTDKKYPATANCRVIATPSTNTVVKSPNCKVQHRVLRSQENVRYITEKGGEYNL